MGILYKTLIFLFCFLIGTAQANTELPTKWNLQIVDSVNVLTDTITTTQKNFWFNKDNCELSSYMLDFKIGRIEPGVYFATHRLPVPSNSKNNGIGVIVNNNKKIGIHNSSSLVSDLLTISEDDVLRFAYNAESHNAYLYNVSKNDIISITLPQDISEYHFETGGRISYSVEGLSYANPNRGGGIEDKTVATYGDIYDMSCLADNEQAFQSFVRSLSVPSIPEPTSTLLSLFAISILVTQRRRKPY